MDRDVQRTRQGTVRWLNVRKRFQARSRFRHFLPALCKQAHTNASPEQAHCVAPSRTIPLCRPSGNIFDSES